VKIEALLMDRVSRLVRNLTFAGAFVSFSIAQAQQDLNTAQPHVERHDFAKAAPAYDLDAGKSEFLSSCAPCHGTDGKGNGSLSTQLKTKPADLTVLAKKTTAFSPLGLHMSLLTVES
jgi:mono/diheme cytochrome c family protein